jgi:hypothetical protein
MRIPPDRGQTNTQQNRKPESRKPYHYLENHAIQYHRDKDGFYIVLSYIIFCLFHMYK